MIKKIVILGFGGNCFDILDTIIEINSLSKKYECIGFLDDNTKYHKESYRGVKVIGSLNEASKFNDTFFVNGIGSPFNFWKKEDLVKKTFIPKNKFESIIHPSAIISKSSNIGLGVVIFSNVTIGANVQIGNHVIILPNSVISHDCKIGDYTSIASCACISGNVFIEKSCYLGANCSILGNLKIDTFSLIGIGSTVLKDVKSNSVMVGNPAVFKRNTIHT